MSIRHNVGNLIGHALRPFHAGESKLAEHQPGMDIGGMGAGLVLSSTRIGPSEPIPQRYAGDGENVSPPLRWTPPPEGTAELVLVCEDPDAPTPRPYIHWVLAGLEPDLRELPEGLAKTDHLTGLPGRPRQGQNSAGTLGYTGPLPPVGHGMHHYHFQLFASNHRLPAGIKLDRGTLVEQLAGHVLAKGCLVGTYER